MNCLLDGCESSSCCVRKRQDQDMLSVNFVSLVYFRVTSPFTLLVCVHISLHCVSSPLPLAGRGMGGKYEATGG